MTTAYSLITDLPAHIAVLPSSSAHAERMVSATKQITTAPRNSLKTETSDSIIYISVEGPTVDEEDPTLALHKWESGRNRRLTYSQPRNSG